MSAPKCPECGHLMSRHEPGLGCLAYWRPYQEGRSDHPGCPCTAGGAA